MSENDGPGDENMSEVVPVAEVITTSTTAENPRAAWEVVLIMYGKRLRKAGKSGGGLGRHEKSAKSFVEWALAQKLSPSDVNETHKKLYADHIGQAGGRGSISKNVDQAAGLGMIEEAGMSMKPQDPEEFEEEEQQEEEQEEEVEEAPKTRRRAAAPPPQVIMVQASPTRGRPKGTTDGYPRAAPRTGAQRLIPRNEKIRIFKRGPTGKRLYINDYTVDDIQGSLPKFIKEYIDQEFGDPSGVTTYEICELDANDKEKGPTSPITIESGNRPQQDESIAQARDALGLVQELRQAEEDRVAKSNELLDEAKKKAVGSGDMNSLMMLMMMQNMQGGRQNNDGDIALKIVERLRGNSGSHIGDLAVALPPPLPPMQMMPPPPPPESQLAPVVNALLAAQLQPKQERGTADFVKEMLAMRELFAPPARDPELTTLLKLLIERTSAPPAQSQGIENLVGTFGKIREMVTTLAPQMNAGGLTGTLQSILTPELGKALGNVIAGGIGKPPAPVAQPPAAPAQPAVDTIRPRVIAIHAAKDESAQVQATLALVQEMYGSPAYAPKFEPALKALLSSDVQPAQALLSDLLKEVRLDLNTPAFVNKVISQLIVNAGGTPPPELAAPVEVAVLPVPAPTVVISPPVAEQVVPIVAPTVELVSTTTTESTPSQVEVVTFAKGRETPPPSNGVTQVETIPQEVTAVS